MSVQNDFNFLHIFATFLVKAAALGCELDGLHFIKSLGFDAQQPVLPLGLVGVPLI